MLGLCALFFIRKINYESWSLVVYIDKLKLKLKPFLFLALIGSGQILDEHVYGDVFFIVQCSVESCAQCDSFLTGQDAEYADTEIQLNSWLGNELLCEQ